MRRMLTAALLGVVLVILLALPGIPARLVPLILDDGSLALSGLAGTLWNGRAARAIVNSAVGPVHLGEVRWQLRPLSLLTGAADLRLESNWGTQRIRLRARARGRRVVVSNLEAGVDAGLIKQLLPVEVEGRFQLQFDRLVVSEGRPEILDGRVVWQDASWNTVSGRRRLGNYAAIFAPDGEGSGSRTNAVIQTLSGDVRAEGEGSFDGERYALRLLIFGAGIDAELSQALSLIASPTENGYLLRLDGRLDS